LDKKSKKNSRTAMKKAHELHELHVYNTGTGENLDRMLMANRGWLVFLSAKYFYLFFRNILNFFFLCGTNILPGKPAMVKWKTFELIGLIRAVISKHPVRAEAQPF
jgi:hypothetical protein